MNDLLSGPGHHVRTYGLVWTKFWARRILFERIMRRLMIGLVWTKFPDHV